MIRTLEILLSIDFEKRYNEYKAKILGAQKPTPPSLSTDFNATRKAQTEALKRNLAKGEETGRIIKEVIDQLSKKELETQPQDNRPFCLIEGKFGYLKFNKNGKKIKIGGSNSQPFKLLKSLTEPFGTAKSVEITFEAVRENMRGKSKSGVYTSDIDRAQKVKIIGYVIKELQKGNKLQGKLEFKWNDPK